MHKHACYDHGMRPFFFGHIRVDIPCTLVEPLDVATLQVYLLTVIEVTTLFNDFITIANLDAHGVNSFNRAVLLILAVKRHAMH